MRDVSETASDARSKRARPTASGDPSRRTRLSARLMKFLSVPLISTVGVLLLIVAFGLAAAYSEDDPEGSNHPLQASPVAATPESGEDGEGGQETPAPTEAPEAPVEEETPPAAGVEGEAPDAGPGDDEFPLWGWIVIGAAAALVFAGLIVWLGRGGRSAAAVQSSWGNMALDTYGRGVAIHDAVLADLTTAPLAGVAVEDAKRRWANAERRIDDLTAELHVLEARTPDDTSARAVRDLLTTLGTLRSAVQSHFYVRTRDEAPTLTDAQLEESESLVRQRLSELDGALRALKTVV
ncbi:MAG: hypothetical protein E3J64_09285 [Anaerolineales bacterium]|nr:MAG: hypothetical protein E3J64_09285 [Anaerolineales bacterium]